MSEGPGEEQCATCAPHTWHGEPCWLRVHTYNTNLTPRLHGFCPCPGAFGVLAEKEPFPHVPANTG